LLARDGISAAAIGRQRLVTPGHGKTAAGTGLTNQSHSKSATWTRYAMILLCELAQVQYRKKIPSRFARGVAVATQLTGRWMPFQVLATIATQKKGGSHDPPFKPSSAN
jgi:hypothetical protein